MSKLWNFEDPKVKNWLGTNWSKAKKSHDQVKAKAIRDFKTKYPYADTESFEYWVDIDRNTGEATLADTRYVGDGKGLYNIGGSSKSYSYSIDSNDFKYKYKNSLYWGPSNGIFQPTTKLFPVQLVEADLGFNLTQFDIYISKDQSFKSDFESLDTNWQGKEDDITKVKFNYKEDKYFASLCASYIIFCKTGICSKHFEEADDVPKVVTSIMRYFVYY